MRERGRGARARSFGRPGRRPRSVDGRMDSEAAAEDGAGAHQQRPASSVWQGFPKGLRVLLVEPNEGDRKDITALLEQCEYKGAHSRAALPLLRRARGRGSGRRRGAGALVWGWTFLPRPAASRPPAVATGSS